MVLKLIIVLVALNFCMAQDPELLSMVTKTGLKYDQVMAWSDQLWIEVESGILSPEQAQAMFFDETGMRVIDFLVKSGEIQLAVQSGLVPQTVVDDLVRG
ncbi:hypothetical protein SteCoe_12248 [Stentor coeruleus]|uniref:Uncharacterized protein n=1 Tax=Stentor coeruleus TaxID=5963 RepID=A0A1R2CB95_9CILI|nr:hypothetical protein SteCoe_12248 [Stentor coeruleus]